MVNINISIKKEAYNYLGSLKAKDKSFSDVILEFKERDIGRKGSKEAIMKFFGALKDMDIDWKEKEKTMKEFRESFNRRVGETIEKMRGKE
jgi:predicted CopG family antitoxin